MTSAFRGIHLKLERLSKSFNAKPVLQDLDLEIESGDFVAIVGRSGCGKSTLLRLVAGLVAPTDGAVLLNGARSHKIGTDVRMMFQDARLLPWKKVLTNVELGLLNFSEGSRYKALQVLHSVGLDDRAKEWPAVLSGGQRQRVALARALVSEPRLLLLDEPLGALDALTRIEMQQLLENLWQEQGFTSLLITHDVEEAVVLADRVILIEEGQIALDIKIDLPRPRQRGSAVFAKTVETIVQRVLGHHEAHAESSRQLSEYSPRLETSQPLQSQFLHE
ncbi:MAG: ATP-binding cassette domain-containing protein [Plectolyngbya sp. WJT66-NPBG17]|jgi:sulfonate transport system ATP-binding protein|nr:ATP-binding cassette domain-containing protein [Plectolyngbya sp. WJT66-NPBG17]